jgi:hypothetical protein
MLTQGASKYMVNSATLGSQPSKAAALKFIQDAVKGLNVYTFNQGARSRDPETGNIIFSYGFPHNDDGPITAEWLTGRIGTNDERHPGMMTNVNTLILRPNCRDVVTSFPGTPRYFSDRDGRIGGSSQIFIRP